MPVPACAPARLVEMLPGVRRTTLATVICGEIATRFDCPSSYLRVLHALIAHAGWHGNRVWASQERLAELAGAVRGICVKTVQRAIRWFVKTVGLRIVSDTGERLRGPGEHHYLASGQQKRGEGPVNHYDLSALRRFVPAELVARDVPRPVPPNPPLSPDPMPDFPNPFAEPASESSPPPETRQLSCPVGKDKEREKAEKPRSKAPRPKGF